jgi:hypothetical protein
VCACVCVREVTGAHGPARTLANSDPLPRLGDLLEGAQADGVAGLQVERHIVVQQQRALARRRRAFDERQSLRRRRSRLVVERRIQVLEHHHSLKRALVSGTFRSSLHELADRGRRELPASHPPSGRECAEGSGGTARVTAVKRTTDCLSPLASQCQVSKHGHTCWRVAAEFKTAAGGDAAPRARCRHARTGVSIYIDRGTRWHAGQVEG